MAALTYNQFKTLTRVREAEAANRVIGVSADRRTMNALERKGLVTLERVPSRHVPHIKMPCWKITAAGLAIIEAA